jgi:hypothetical protein
VIGAHISRAQGSEYTGSVAWENAVRMRWYLGSRLPDQRADDDEQNSNSRYLAKRKSIYSALDHVRFTMREGVLVPDAPGGHVGGLVAALDARHAEEVCLAGFKRLQGPGIHPTDAKNSPDYLPRQLVEKQLQDGYTKRQLADAMNRLMVRGTLSRGVVGRYGNRGQRFGLVLAQEQAT